MKNLKEFVNTTVRIEFIKDSDCFGHYPFQLFSEKEDGGYELNALALGGDVASCYRRFAHYKNENAKRIYLSIDFPATGDIKNDFVAIISFEDGVLNIHAIPYDENGQRLPSITDSRILDIIKEESSTYMH